LSVKRGLSQSQVAEYEQEGFVVLPNYLDEDDLAPAREAMSATVDLIATDLMEAGLIKDPLVSEPFETRLAQLFDGLDDRHFLKFGRGWRDRLPGYFQLMSNQKVLDGIESLIGPEIFSNPVYNVRPKVPKVAAGAVPWHQDKSYWPGASSSPVITAWIPMVDATMENGCLHVIPRTQHEAVHCHHAETYSGTGYTEIDETALRSQLRRRVEALPVRAGTVILFNDRFIHSSTPNLSEHVRWSLDLRYQPTDQDPLKDHGIGFLARSALRPEAVATVEDWLAQRTERGEPNVLVSL